MTPLAVAVLLGAAAALLVRSRPVVRRVAVAGPRPEPEESLLRRHRKVLALACGAGAWVFLGGAVGVAAGGAAVVFAWRFLGRLQGPQARRRAAAIEADLPGALDLLVAGFVAGLSPGPALALVAEALPGDVGDEFAAIRRRLDLGTDPATVWSELSSHPQLGPLGRALGRAHGRGASVVIATERLAEELREQAGARVEGQARSVSTRAAAPLGACFLPAFVLLAIVPLVAGLLRDLQLFG